MKKEKYLIIENNTLTEQYICNIPIIKRKKDKKIILEKNKEFTVIIDYPLEKPVTFKLNTQNGLTFKQLINEIRNFYKLIYKEPEKYEIWGHNISDLWIEKIQIEHQNNTITLVIGS